MDTQLQFLFDQLLEQQAITVPVLDRSHAESLRTGMMRKLRQYKELWDSTGFLTDQMRATGIGFKLDDDGVVATIKLQQRRRTFNYEFLHLVGGNES